MPTQKRVSRSSSKKAVKSAPARTRAKLKASPTRRKRSTSSTTTSARAGRKGGGVIKRAIKKGISELAKVGT